MRFVPLQSAVMFTSINDVVLWLKSLGQYTFFLPIIVLPYSTRS